MKYNTAPALTAVGISASLVLGGCSSPEQTSPPNPSTATSAPAPQARCQDAKLSDFVKEPTLPEGPSSYTVTSIAVQNCVSLFDLSTRRDVAILYQGSGFENPCLPDDKPQRLHTRSGNIVGEILLNEQGMSKALALGISACSVATELPTTTVVIPQPPVPDYCWQDPRLKGCQDF